MLLKLLNAILTKEMVFLLDLISKSNKSPKYDYRYDSITNYDAKAM